MDPPWRRCLKGDYNRSWMSGPQPPQAGDPTEDIIIIIYDIRICCIIHVLQILGEKWGAEVMNVPLYVLRSVVQYRSYGQHKHCYEGGGVEVVVRNQMQGSKVDSASKQLSV